MPPAGTRANPKKDPRSFAMDARNPRSKGPFEANPVSLNAGSHQGLPTIQPRLRDYAPFTDSPRAHRHTKDGEVCADRTGSARTSRNRDDDSRNRESSLFIVHPRNEGLRSSAEVDPKSKSGAGDLAYTHPSMVAFIASQASV